MQHNRRRQVTLPLAELALIAGTRAIAGAGIGLLAAGKLSTHLRKATGLTLLFVGATSTLPLALDVWARMRREGPNH